MKYIFYGIIILYALLSILAASVQMKASKKRDTSILMLAGGLFLIAAVFLYKMAYSVIILIAGGVLISVAAFINGKRSGNFHIVHHIIRFAVTVLLVIGFILVGR